MDDEPNRDKFVKRRRTELEGGWVVSIYLSQPVSEVGLSGYAELRRGRAFECRIALAGHFHDPWLAANSLQTKAIEWIDDWNAREHSGETGFADI